MYNLYNLVLSYLLSRLVTLQTLRGAFPFALVARPRRRDQGSGLNENFLPLFPLTISAKPAGMSFSVNATLPP